MRCAVVDRPEEDAAVFHTLDRDSKSGRQMTGAHAIIPGAVLVEGNTFLPDSLWLESDSNGGGWSRVRNHPDGGQLGKALAAAGWSFFFMAGGIRKISFGLDGAMKRLIEAVKLQKCNCLEIDNVGAHSFLGMQYVSVSAHARHIQKSMAFSVQEQQ